MGITMKMGTLLLVAGAAAVFLMGRARAQGATNSINDEVPGVSLEYWNTLEPNPNAVGTPFFDEAPWQAQKDQLMAAFNYSWNQSRIDSQGTQYAAALENLNRQLAAIGADLEQARYSAFNPVTGEYWG